MADAPKRTRPRRRPARSTLLLRWLALAGLALVALLYYRPLRTWVSTRHTLTQRSDQVRLLQAEKRLLERRVTESASNAALVREARRLGLVKRGERLFIVKGIDAWRHGRSTIGAHG